MYNAFQTYVHISLGTVTVFNKCVSTGSSLIVFCTHNSNTVANSAQGCRKKLKPLEITNSAGSPDRPSFIDTDNEIPCLSTPARFWRDPPPPTKSAGPQPPFGAYAKFTFVVHSDVRFLPRLHSRMPPELDVGADTQWPQRPPETADTRAFVLRKQFMRPGSDMRNLRSPGPSVVRVSSTLWFKHYIQPPLRLAFRLIHSGQTLILLLQLQLQYRRSDRVASADAGDSLCRDSRHQWFRHGVLRTE